eukprot:CAMPEP_0196757754 /NCGR_PEP_ID=MMETSP1091-20130531/103827_1 /TAXON_ID=302021 /ORGANISM="Rhodomonas sp., Strain CCMP768" /LENGTH=1517 /DNA_ID=CAMNT_0042106539 /DNA_START=95 /DNA_END=4648 /DNA_ORIENTATION=-
MAMRKAIFFAVLLASLAHTSADDASQDARCVCEDEAKYCDVMAACTGRGSAPFEEGKCARTFWDAQDFNKPVCTCPQGAWGNGISTLEVEDGGTGCFPESYMLCTCPQGAWGNGISTLEVEDGGTGCFPESYMLYVSGTADLGTTPTEDAPGEANRAAGILTISAVGVDFNDGAAGIAALGLPSLNGGMGPFSTWNEPSEEFVSAFGPNSFDDVTSTLEDSIGKFENSPFDYMRALSDSAITRDMLYVSGTADLGTTPTEDAPGEANRAAGILTISAVGVDLNNGAAGIAALGLPSLNGGMVPFSTWNEPSDEFASAFGPASFDDVTSLSTLDQSIGKFENSPYYYMRALSDSAITRVTPTGAGTGSAGIQMFFRTSTQAHQVKDNIKTKVDSRRRAMAGTRRSDCNTGFRFFGGVCIDEDSFFQVYAHTMDSSSMPIEVTPVGLEITAISFDITCGQAGCWVFDVTYGIGQDNWNVFYLPKAENPDHATASTDFDYSTIVYQWGYEAIEDDSDLFYLGEMTALDTFLQPNFPCRSYAYNNQQSDGKPPFRSLTSCCIKPFLDMYRPVGGFATAMNALPVVKNYTFACNKYNASAHPFYADGPPMFLGSPTDSVSWDPSTAEYRYNKSASYLGGGAGTTAEGMFDGMSHSWVVNLGILDPITLVHKGRVYVDELEMRSKAGKLTGEPAVEYTVETFIGLAEFRPTNTFILDVATKQIKVTLEKTNYFSVSVIAENDITFLSYVNMRLVDVYNADTELQETGSELTDRTYRTNSSVSAQYLQMTFTLDDERYQPDSLEEEEPKIIPLDSVRVSKGDFLSEDEMHHACMEWNDPSASGNQVFTQAMYDTFFTRINQDCAPRSSMCANPTSIPDQFVSFNVPLGIDWIPPSAADLSSNVFVDLVITAELRGSDVTGSANDQAEQFKTRLTGSIPVVEGGQNIFCDQITAKTDLVDVANLDLILGSANSDDELSRLFIKKDIASSSVTRQSASLIESDSIEAGLMTLVIKGNASFFDLDRTTASGYGMQLEDVITVHIMEGPWASDPFEASADTVADDVLALVSADPQDNYDTNGDLRTTGYDVNGAFHVEIDRASATALLQPKPELVALCPWRATAVSGVPANGFPSTCVLRRDVRQRTVSQYAHEIKPDGGSDDGAFMQSVLGNSNYADTLGGQFASVVLNEYTITADTNRYRRAFWINPTYEWTPTLTGGREIFSLSQKIFLFALIRLDEQYGSGRRSGRRMVLQAEAQGDGTTGANGDIVVFSTSRAQVIANTLALPLGNVQTYGITKQLTDQQACMDASALREEVWGAVKADLQEVASELAEVIIARFDVDRGSVQCRRALKTRGLLASSGGATVDMDVMVAFSLAEEPSLDAASLMDKGGYAAIRSPDGTDNAPMPTPDGGWPSVTPEPGGDSGEGGMSAATEHLITGLAGAAFVVVFPLLTFFLVRRYRVEQLRKQRAYRPQTNVVNADLIAQLKAEAAGGNFGSSSEAAATPTASASLEGAGPKQGTRTEIAF